MSPEPRLRVKRLRATARLPRRATPQSSGLDLYADLGGEAETLRLGPAPQLVPTGIALQVEPGYEVQVRPRSGLSSKGVDVAFGTIDADYRGEVLVNMATRAGASDGHVVRHGDRIAQLVVAPVALAEVEEVEELDASDRAEDGFGSSGR